MARKQEIYVFKDTTCEAASRKAVLVCVDGDEVWVPRSQLHDDNEVNDKGDSGSLVVAAWFAKKDIASDPDDAFNGEIG